MIQMTNMWMTEMSAHIGNTHNGSHLPDSADAKSKQPTKERCITASTRTPFHISNTSKHNRWERLLVMGMAVPRRGWGSSHHCSVISDIRQAALVDILEFGELLHFRVG